MQFIVSALAFGVIAAFAVGAVEDWWGRRKLRLEEEERQRNYVAFILKYRTRPGWLFDLEDKVWTNTRPPYERQSEAEWIAQVDREEASNRAVPQSAGRIA